MELHHPTLFITILVGFAILAIQLALLQRGPLREDAVIRWWAFGTWSGLVGYGSILARDWLPLQGALLLANSANELTLACFAAAIHRFLWASAPPRWLWWLLGSQIVALLVVLPEPQPLRVVVASSSHALLLLPSLWWLHRAGPCPERLMRMVALSLQVIELLLLFRAADAALNPQLYQLHSLSGWRQGAAFAAGFVFLLGTGFGFALVNFERVARRLDALAHTDALTGCLNRRAGDGLMERLLGESRQRRVPLALVLLDLDHFKQVNDRHGHRTGDLVLQQFADVARSYLPFDAQLARMGGEEFCIILPAADAVSARGTAEAVRRAVAAQSLRDARDEPLWLTVSAGVAVSSCGPGDTPDLAVSALYSRADEALYRAKSSGRNRVECASAEVRAVTSA